MSLSQHARPTPANIRTRLRRLQESAENGAELAGRWQPRDHRRHTRNQVIDLFEFVERESVRLLARMNR